LQRKLVNIYRMEKNADYCPLCDEGHKMSPSCGQVRWGCYRGTPVWLLQVNERDLEADGNTDEARRKKVRVDDIIMLELVTDHDDPPGAEVGRAC
jgi:hypothetical protein